MTLLFRLCCLLFAWLCLPCAAAHSTPQVQVSLRQHVYHVGDRLQQSVWLRGVTAKDVDRNSLPLPGPVRPWLDLTSIEVIPAGQDTTLNSTWQVFATVETVQALSLPAWTLKVQGTPAHTLQVPASTFYQSPAFASAVNAVARKATHAPLRYDLRLWQGLVAVSVVCSLLLAVAALWIQDRLPCVPFRPGPLCRAQRQLQRQRALPPLQALMLVYRSLGEVAGATLHDANVSRLFDTAAYLSPLRSEIEAFVQGYSQLVFNFTPLSAEAVSRPPDAAALHSRMQQWLPQAALLERTLKAGKA